MSAEIVSSWDAATRVLPAASPLTGPFPKAPFLQAWESQFAKPNPQTLIVRSADGAVPIWVDGRTIRFQGEENVTDYHAPLGSSIEPHMTVLRRQFSGFNFSFDSVPIEVRDDLLRSLDPVSTSVSVREHAAALILDLPTEPGAWLASLPKKHRHEVRRKQRRFVDLAGEPVYERRNDEEAFAAFLAMHRRAPGTKSAFMTARAETFFLALLTDVGASVDLLSVGERPVAAAFGFAEQQCYYLYNSAYEPALAEAAPGIVLIAAMIERSISDGLARFDFLKGDERYKYHLGAVERPLSVIEGRFA
jgi:CelD/BcsL family acetyltransferase involved in cellulose biosynthesis